MLNVLLMYIIHTYMYVNLSFVYRRAREDLKNANQRINQMLADYGDVVSRREYETLQASNNVC